MLPQHLQQVVPQSRSAGSQAGRFAGLLHGRLGPGQRLAGRNLQSANLKDNEYPPKIST